MNYSQDYNNFVDNNTPEVHRKDRFLSWLKALVRPVQWKHDAYFGTYANGITGATLPYDSGTTYNTGDTTLGDNNAVYESLKDGVIGINPAITENNALYAGNWVRRSPDFRGVNERLKYTGQTMVLEYVLNKWFRTNFVQPDQAIDPQTTRSDIYIVNNQLNNDVFVVADNEAMSSASFNYDIYSEDFVKDDYDFVSAAFTIFVPESGLSPIPGWYTNLDPYKEQKIRSIADRYVIAGIVYDIQTY